MKKRYRLSFRRIQGLSNQNAIKILSRALRIDEEKAELFIQGRYQLPPLLDEPKVDRAISILSRYGVYCDKEILHEKVESIDKLKQQNQVLLSQLKRAKSVIIQLREENARLTQLPLVDMDKPPESILGRQKQIGSTKSAPVQEKLNTDNTDGSVGKRSKFENLSNLKEKLASINLPYPVKTLLGWILKSIIPFANKQEAGRRRFGETFSIVFGYFAYCAFGMVVGNIATAFLKNGDSTSFWLSPIELGIAFCILFGALHHRKVRKKRQCPSCRRTYSLIYTGDKELVTVDSEEEYLSKVEYRTKNLFTGKPSYREERTKDMIQYYTVSTFNEFHYCENCKEISTQRFHTRELDKTVVTATTPWQRT